jgi:nickel-dependent lactate racemase
LSSEVTALDYLVAQGTHQPLTESALNRLVGVTAEERVTTFSNTRILNHRWENPDTFVTKGRIPAEEIEAMVRPHLPPMDHETNLFREVSVTMNRLIDDYDQLIICGPTFPHEVVGFSGGNKYFFPGISGADVINYTHWLGAVLTSSRTIGHAHTPVRQVIDRAAEFIDRPKLCFSLVVTGQALAGLYIGEPKEAFLAAAKLSAKRHIRWLDKPVQRVLSIMPEMYEDIWTASKGFYKLEPVVEDNGEVIIYAPHIREFSYSHGDLLDEIGYHVRDYFVKQWDQFKKYPGGVLAHSTHFRGRGEYEAITGVEKARIRVTLATKISAGRCRRLGVGYLDPESIDPERWGEGCDGLLRVSKAGEILYRLQSDTGSSF